MDATEAITEAQKKAKINKMVNRLRVLYKNLDIEIQFVMQLGGTAQTMFSHSEAEEFGHVPTMLADIVHHESLMLYSNQIKNVLKDMQDLFPKPAGIIIPRKSNIILPN
jgi:hypothetical protein